MKKIEDKAYCDRCDAIKMFKVVDTKKYGIVLDKRYIYNGKKAICESCGNEVYDSRVRTSNLCELYRAYIKSGNCPKKISKKIIKYYGLEEEER